MKKTLLALCITLVSPLYVGAQLADDYGTSSTVRGAGYCPNLSITMQRGSTDATTQGQASQLQRFLIERGYLDIDAPTGRIAGLTVQAIKDFQTENNLPAYGIAGSLTRAAIARVCSGNVATTTTTSTNTTTGTTAGTATTLAPSATFTASTYTTTAGQPVSLAWSSTNTTSCSVRNSQTGGNGGTVLTLGTQVVYPTVTTTYTLTCINQNATPQQEITKTVTVTVGSTTTTNTTVQAPTLSVNLSPSSIVRGGSVSLSWTSTGATACTGKNAALTTSEPLALSGSRTLSPTQTTTYKIECTGANGQVVSVEKTATVQQATTTTTTTTTTGASSVSVVSSTNTLVTGYYSNLPGGTQILLVNKGTGAQLTTPSAYTGVQGGSAAFTIAIDSSVPYGTYALRAFNNSMILAESPTTFSITAPNITVPAIALSASSYTIQAGQSTQIAWNTNGATSCTAYYSGKTETVATQGQSTVTLREPTTYKLICTNGSASAEKSITINVTGYYGNLQPLSSITQTKASTVSGESFDITWSSSYASSCRVETSYNGAEWSYAAEGTSGTRTVAPTTVGTYQARVVCTGGSETTPAEARITHSVTGATAPTTSAPTVALSAASYSIISGQSTQIAWNTINANLCTAYYGNVTESVALQGQITVTPSQTTTYRLVCSNNSAPAEKSITITVTPVSTVLAPTLAQIYLNPTTVTTQTPFQVTWSGNNSPSRYTVKVNNTEIPQGTNTTWTGTAASLGLGAGTHLFSAQACNVIGCSPWTGVFFLTVTN